MTASTATTIASTEKKYLIVIPTYNEVVNIGIMLRDILALTPAVDVLVVDDGSPDGTGDVVEKHPEYGRRVFLLRRARKSGYAGACKEGLRWGHGRGYDACGTMDADRSHDPADVPRLIAALNDGADIAVGSRYRDGIRIINWPLSRLLLSSFAGVYVRALCGIPMTDPTSGFKLISRKVQEGIDFSRCAADGYGFITEFHFFVFRGGFRIAEVPIIFTERQQGASKMSKRIIFESAWTVLKLGCLRLFTKKKAA